MGLLRIPQSHCDWVCKCGCVSSRSGSVPVAVHSGSCRLGTMKVKICVSGVAAASGQTRHTGIRGINRGAEQVGYDESGCASSRLGSWSGTMKVVAVVVGQGR